MELAEILTTTREKAQDLREKLETLDRRRQDVSKQLKLQTYMVAELEKMLPPDSDDISARTKDNDQPGPMIIPGSVVSAAFSILAESGPLMHPGLTREIQQNPEHQDKKDRNIDAALKRHGKKPDALFRSTGKGSNRKWRLSKLGKERLS